MAESMEAIETIEALRMALSGFLKKPERPSQLTRHSDRGSQYCSDIYVKLLQDENINISMTESGDPLENAVAERLNGIIKEEYLNDHIADNIEHAKKLLDNAVSLYNKQRPHQSIGYLTPEYVHQNKTKTEKLWKNYYRKNSNIVNSLQDLNITVNV